MSCSQLLTCSPVGAPPSPASPLFVLQIGRTHLPIPTSVDIFFHCDSGVERLLRHLHAHGIPIAIATSSHSRSFALKTARHDEIFSLFSTIVRGDDPEVKRGKPSPDIFQMASSRFPSPPASPANVLVFEDAPNGIQAAKAAEMWAVMVPDPLLGKELTGSADQVIYSLQDFEPTAWGLPPFKS